jgi:hypothetical protein
MELYERLVALEQDVGRGRFDDRHHRILTGIHAGDNPPPRAASRTAIRSS